MYKLCINCGYMNGWNLYIEANWSLQFWNSLTSLPGQRSLGMRLGTAILLKHPHTIEAVTKYNKDIYMVTKLISSQPHSREALPLLPMQYCPAS